MRLEDLGLVGNCQYAALVGLDGNVVWCCLPRFDAEPVFAALTSRIVMGERLGAKALAGAGLVGAVAPLPVFLYVALAHLVHPLITFTKTSRRLVAVPQS